MREKAMKEIREEPVAQGITLNPRQFEAMMANLTRSLDNWLQPKKILPLKEEATKLIQSDKGKSPITPTRAKNVECCKSQSITNLTHPDFTTKKNHSKRIPPEEDMEDSIRQIPNEREGDIRPINQVYQPNQEELSHDSTCSRNLTQEGISEKKNRLKSSLHKEDIQLTSRRTCMEPESEQRLSNEAFRSKQDEPRCKPTCFRKLTHQRNVENRFHYKIYHGLKVIKLLNQKISDSPYLQAPGFNHLQTRIWRPGEAHNHSGGTYVHPGRSFIILEGLDLRTNPFKGGGDGVILDGPDLINSPSSEEDYQHGLLTLEEEALGVCCGPLELIQKKQRQPKPRCSRGRLWTKEKRQRAYGKTHKSDGSEVESKTLESRPPDGPNEANNLCMGYSPTRRAQFVWAKGEKQEEPKTMLLQVQSDPGEGKPNSQAQTPSRP